MVDIASILMKPEVYDENIKNIRLIQTHISWLFLTGKYVYKIKKPVNFGFLDFTTLENRKFYCEKELELNKRLAPDMYLEVVPINEYDGKIKIKGEGKTIEYTVKMKEIPQENMMLKLLNKNKIGNEVINKISKLLSDFHTSAETPKNFDLYKTVKFNWDENFEQTKQFIGNTIDKDKFYFIEKNIRNFIEDNEKLFKNRIYDGKVKDCHGDLHSGNIFISDKIYIFDAIEFNERFRFGDVASEIAFLAMDLDFHNRTDLSNYFVQKYLEYSKDSELKNFLNFYKCYRAFVRGKVISFKLNDKDISNKEKQESEKTARKYFDLAFEYSERMNQSVIIVCGLIGTGKSNFSKKISRKIKAKIIRSDVVRKELAEISPSTHKFEEFKEGIYSDEFTDMTYNEMIKKARKFLLQGSSCIFDATFSKKKYRIAVSNLADEFNSSFFIVECVANDDLIKKRLEKRLETKSVSDGRWKIYYKQKKEFEPITADEKTHIIVDTSKKFNEKEVLRKIFTWL
jgi:aminoglycoside phosphotransferase family enzyme/predicted kinase